MPSDYYDNDESDSSPDETMDMEGETDIPEEKLGIVPMTFFKNEVEPGDTEKIEVVRIADGEAVIKCIYGEDKDKEEESEEPQMSEESAPSEAEDSMMA